MAPEIQAEIGPLLAALAALGVEPVRTRYDRESFGNFEVECSSPRGWLTIVRDRGQYFVDPASKEELKTAGLFRTFDDPAQLKTALLTWLGGREA